MPRILASLPVFALLSGCVIVLGGDKDGAPIIDSGVSCDMMAVSSVAISVVDPSGNPTAATGVWYTTEYSDESVPAECMDADCKTWVAGWEIEGAITVFGEIYRPLEDSSCWQEDHDSLTVTVPLTPDGCHVVTQSAVLTLDPSLIVCPEG